MSGTQNTVHVAEVATIKSTPRRALASIENTGRPDRTQLKQTTLNTEANVCQDSPKPKAPAKTESKTLKRRSHSTTEAPKKKTKVALTRAEKRLINHGFKIRFVTRSEIRKNFSSAQQEKPNRLIHRVRPSVWEDRRPQTVG
eukprot:Clim_evm2s70 gene=Clim_evmTU2s70